MDEAPATPGETLAAKHLPEILGEHSRLTVQVYLVLRAIFILASLSVLIYPAYFTNGLLTNEPQETLLRQAWLIFVLWSLPIAIFGIRAAWGRGSLYIADLLISASILPDGLALLLASQATGGLTSPFYHSIYFLIAVYAYHFPDLLMSRIGSRAQSLAQSSIGAGLILLISMSVFCQLTGDLSNVPRSRYWLELGLQSVIAAAFILVRYSSIEKYRLLAKREVLLEVTREKLQRARGNERQILEAMRNLTAIAEISDENALRNHLCHLAQEIGKLYRVELCAFFLFQDRDGGQSAYPFVNGPLNDQAREALTSLATCASLKDSFLRSALSQGPTPFVWNAIHDEDFVDLSTEDLANLGVVPHRKAVRLLRDCVLPSRRLKNILVVPMQPSQNSDTAVGCILLLNQLEGEPFGPGEVESLPTIGGQLAIIFDNFRNHKVRLQRADQERFFSQLSLTDDLDDLFQSILQYLNQKYNSRVASLWFVTEDGFGHRDESLRVALRSVAVAPNPEDFERELLEKRLQESSIFKLDDCFIGNFFREDSEAPPQVVYVEDLSAGPDCWAPLRNAIGTSQLIALPLRLPTEPFAATGARSRVMGVACIRPLEQLRFDDIQRRQLEAFAKIFVVLMEQVWYRRAYRRFEVLKDSLPSLSPNNLASLYHGLVELVKRLLNAEVCTYFTYGAEGELILKATTANKVRRFQNNRYEIVDASSICDQIAYPPQVESITGKIAETRQTTLFYNVYDSRYMTRVFMEVGTTSDHQSMIGAPIIDSDGKLLGVLRCINKKKEGAFLCAFVQADKDFLDLTVGIIARFIENAEADESKRDFLNQLAHEVSSPLAALRTQIDFIEEVFVGGRHIRDPEEQFGYLREQADFIDYILRDIQYQFGKGASIRADYQFSSKVDLVPMIERLKKLLLPTSRMDKQIDIITSTTRMPFLYVDVRRLEQVIFNLLLNAIKYSHVGANDIFVGYDLVTDDDASTNWHRIFVQNFGIGVRDADEDFIFDEYRRGTNIEGAPSGTGLGLAVAKKIVEAHGGRLHLVSKHRPTIFAVDLPEHLALEPLDQ